MVGLRLIQRLKWDLKQSRTTISSLSFCILCCFSTVVTHYHLLFVLLHSYQLFNIYCYNVFFLI
ncbi:hypothetical protein MtrunA17_Chr4g0019251 [Medicago truncatula]|uniref:Transmembrane protein n=1 Tax=Medicago truncatula TaxID=3880 RepID=A0A396I577_MEDTR|nr:hypothetical protein MtrunA17_Chr4g0019251 [Medicago truncatula]